MAMSEHVVVARFRNDSDREVRLYLEMLGQEVVMSSGHSVDLLACPSEALLPITIEYVEGGLQIHPHKEFDPNWHIRFAGKLIKAGNPTVLSEYE